MKLPELDSSRYLAVSIGVLQPFGHADDVRHRSCKAVFPSPALFVAYACDKGILPVTA